jgi:methionine-rich copper-binding protein CopC
MVAPSGSSVGVASDVVAAGRAGYRGGASAVHRRRIGGAPSLFSVDSHVMSLLAVTRPFVRSLLVGAALVLVLAPAVALGHAELDTSTPSDGDTVTGTPPLIEATYTEDLDPDGSSLVLVDASGKELATGGVATTSEATKQMTIPTVPELAPGEYTVKSTTKSTADGDVDRTTWSFTVIAAPSPTPSPVASTAPTATPTAAASPSTAASAPVVASVPAVTPAPSPSGGGEPAASTSDVLLPIIAGLAIVIVAAVWLARRRGRTSPPA